MKYSLLIRRNLPFIERNEYVIYPNGKQIYKKLENYEVLITDFSMKPGFELFDVINILVWIKDSKTDEVVVEKYFSSFFFPSIKKIERFVVEEIEKLNSPTKC